MKIKKIQVKNYRLLQNFSLDLENELSLVIGKNNCGKTSLLLVLNKFLNSVKFTSDDFNLGYKKVLSEYIITSFPCEEDYKEDGIYLRLFIEYDENDDLSNINELMMDLDENNNQVVLNFEYILTYNKLLQMQLDFYNLTNFDGTTEEKFKYFFKNESSEYFNRSEQSILLDTNNIIVDFIDLKKENINLKNIINYKFISAKREVSNKDVDKTLSSQTSRIYDKTESTPEQKEAIDNFKIELLNTDKKLDDNYKVIFENIINKVGRFGGIKSGESSISIHSTLQHQELLKGNTTVMYSHEDDSLPEHYNGLGYMNLISMIFEIETLLFDFKKSLDEKPADINLLFIEEPEAHTHPQMQYIFIKNIKSLLENGIVRQDGNNRKLQYIITTHSSHIVSESDFDDIKYLKKQNKNSVISKNLKDLEKEYINNGEEQNYKFLKQYLTLNRAELFFADKAILIEGDTERILIPAMMKKIDNESNVDDEKLLSQNISIVEVGAHSKIFEKFINFIGVKTIIITDIDGYYEKTLYEADGITPKTYQNGNVKKEVIKCPTSDVDIEFIDNHSLLYFHSKRKEDINYFKVLSFSQKVLQKNIHGKYCQNTNGNLLLVYQTKEENSNNEIYHARSFEDSFFHINKEFMKNDFNNFYSLTKKWLDKFKNGDIDSFELANKGVNSKPSLAIEILMNESRTPNDSTDCTLWNIPSYIKEGLIWLRDN
ncbi:AAA family ATPase [Aliarcobacter sp. ERUVET-7]|uniref:AAA family ATPase n=1 Tax=Aliarcobacter sp. ERUVET-7 TaxID=3429683 RepID=UPI003D6AED25